MAPAYIRIHDVIKKEISGGVWEIGQRLLNGRDLADDYEVSRIALHQVVVLLAKEGTLECRAGSRTYVANHRVQGKMHGTTGFTEVVCSWGKTPSSQLISYQRKPANETEIQQLQLKATDIVVRAERVRFADNAPLVFEVVSIPEELIQSFSQEAITECFFRTLMDNGCKIGKSQQAIYARNTNERVANYLKMSRDHVVLALTQVSYFTDG